MHMTSRSLSALALMSLLVLAAGGLVGAQEPLTVTGADGERILEFEVAGVAPVLSDGIDDLGCDQAETSALARLGASGFH